MTKSNWIVIWCVLIAGIGGVVWLDKGSYLNAVMTRQCNSCPAPRVCLGSRAGTPVTRGAYLPAIDGCDPPWWKRRG
jgi:hypothetical protein